MSMPDPAGSARRLDRKLDAITAGRYTPGDFVLADAKDADMAFGLTSAGPAGAGRYRTRGEFLDDMRALVAQGDLDMVSSRSSTPTRRPAWPAVRSARSSTTRSPAPWPGSPARSGRCS